MPNQMVREFGMTNENMYSENTSVNKRERQKTQSPMRTLNDVYISPSEQKKPNNNLDI